MTLQSHCDPRARALAQPQCGFYPPLSLALQNVIHLTHTPSAQRAPHDRPTAPHRTARASRPTAPHRAFHPGNDINNTRARFRCFTTEVAWKHPPSRCLPTTERGRGVFWEL